MEEFVVDSSVGGRRKVVGQRSRRIASIGIAQGLRKLKYREG